VSAHDQGEIVLSVWLEAQRRIWERWFESAQDSAQLSRLYWEAWQKSAQPWVESTWFAPKHFRHGGTGDSTALIELTKLCWDAYDRTFGRLLDTPSLGYTREFSEKLTKGWKAGGELGRASVEYHALLTEGWCRAWGRFFRELVALASKGESIQSLRQLLELWLDTCDEIFTALSRSETYVASQSRLLNSALAYTLIEHNLAEAYLKTSPIATRSELDEAYRRIYELRKAVKEIVKTMRSQKSDSLKIDAPADGPGPQLEPPARGSAV
jgi:hypothetical protein